MATGGGTVHCTGLLLLLCCLLRRSDSAGPTLPSPLNESDIRNDWTPSSAQLDAPRFFSSVVFYNDSFLVVGGCMDASCGWSSLIAPDTEVFSTALCFYVPTALTVQALPPMPIYVDVMGTSGMLRRLGVAGSHAVVAVGSVDPATNDFATKLFVVGPCSLCRRTDRFRRNPGLLSVYRMLWKLSDALDVVDDTADVPVDRTRCNASCTAFGSQIFIIGGVWLASDGTPSDITSAIDMFDVETGVYSKAVASHVEPVMNAALTIDNNMVFVAGGITKNLGSKVNFETGFGLVPSVRVVGYLLTGATYNSSTTLNTVLFPNNDYLALIQAFSLFGPPAQISSFANALEILHPTGASSELDMTHAYFVPVPCPYDDSSYMLELRNATWVTMSWDIMVVPCATLVAFPFPNSFQGTTLTYYAFGGVAADGSLSSSIFSKFSTCRVSVPIGTIPAYVPTGKYINFTFTPPDKGYVRLSGNGACYGNAAGTLDVFMKPSAVVTFLLLFPSRTTFICFAREPIPILHCPSCKPKSIQTFVVTDPYSPFVVMKYIPPYRTTTWQPANVTLPPDKISKPIVVLFASFGVMLIAGSIAAIVTFARKGRRAHRRLRGEEFMLPEDETDERTVEDRIVRNTTSDSKYRIIRRIGQGTFSTVFLARRKSDGVEFALKFMVCADDRERLEAIKECETINSLQGHRNIITLYDMFMNYEFGKKPSTESEPLLLSTHGGSPRHNTTPTATPPGGATLAHNQQPLSPINNSQPYAARHSSNLAGEISNGSVSGSSDSGTVPIHTRYLCLVMEYHAQGDLARFVMQCARHYPHRPQAINEKALLSITFQMCSALHHLHSQRPPVVHRDLKPENVLLVGRPSPEDTYLEIVVTDFGLALIKDEHRQSGRGGGTRPYIAPECWKGSTCTASDIWSLGCVLYAVATQRLTSDIVRIMFVDARSPNFTTQIFNDIVAQQYSAELANFITSLLVLDVRVRPTAAKLLECFRVDGTDVSLAPARSNES